MENPVFEYAFASEDGKKMLTFLREKNKQGVGVEELEAEESEEIRACSKDVQKRMKEFYEQKIKYTDREIVLDD